MSNCPFCNLTETQNAIPAIRPPTLLRRTWQGIQWLTPPTLLVLMPKCPLCVVAYVALFTGIGITVTTARWIEILMPLLCAASLTYLAFRLWRNRSRAGSRIADGG